MLKVKKLSLVVFILLGFSVGHVIAQKPSTHHQRAPQQQRAAEQKPVNLSDDELRGFVEAFIDIRAVDQKAQEKMTKVVEAEGIGINRFNEVQQAIHNPNMESNATEQELEKVENAGQKVTEIRVNAQREMQQKIEEKGLSLERYQEISMMIQSNSDIETQFNQIYHELTN